MRRILSSDTQRPSGVYEWQMPDPSAEPIPPFYAFRPRMPLLEQEASYFAASARIASFFCTCMVPLVRLRVADTNLPNVSRKCNRDWRCTWRILGRGLSWGRGIAGALPYDGRETEIGSRARTGHAACPFGGPEPSQRIA